jgi:hypothetical protein
MSIQTYTKIPGISKHKIPENKREITDKSVFTLDILKNLSKSLF